MEKPSKLQSTDDAYQGQRLAPVLINQCRQFITGSAKALTTLVYPAGNYFRSCRHTTGEKAWTADTESKIKTKG
jgi:hypothetical protein